MAGGNLDAVVAQAKRTGSGSTPLRSGRSA